MNTWVTIPCHRPYLEKLYDCLESVHAAGVGPHRIFVVTNGDDPIKSGEIGGAARLIHYEGEFNMSRWWNLGLDCIAAENRGHEHEALVLNADALVDDDCIGLLAVMLRSRELAVTAPDIYKFNEPHQSVRILRELLPLTKAESLPGCCMMLRGELDLRFDTRIPGWFNDDDMDWQGRERGGVGMVRDAVVHHTDHGTGGSFRDEGLAVFKAKWGWDPWK